MTRFCVTCRHYSILYPSQHALCKAPILDLVSGEPIQDGPSHVADNFTCILMRRPDAPCGPDGRLWEGETPVVRQQWETV